MQDESLLVLEAAGAVLLVLALVWRRELSLPAVLLAFFAAGLETPVKGLAQQGRWLVLAIAICVGCLLLLSRVKWGIRFGGFHAAAAFAVLAIALSYNVSINPALTLYKAGSIALLFAYCAVGACLAVRWRNEGFLANLLLGCEAAVYVSFAAYFVLGYPLFGNPNSLGAVMGILCFPVLVWGACVAKKKSRLYRLLVAVLLCGLLLLNSVARAGIMAAVAGAITILLPMRMYRQLFIGGIILTVALGALVLFSPDRWDTLVSGAEQLVYKGNTDEALIQSRLSPWDESMQVIGEHPWFGTGFGATKGMSEDWEGGYSTQGLMRERGNSLLALFEGVGLVGAAPALVMLFLLLRNVVRVCTRLRRAHDATDLSIPLAAILVGGLFHTFFEEWLLAAGYYMCVVFWVCAFLLIDHESRRAAADRRWERNPSAALSPLLQSK